MKSACGKLLTKIILMPSGISSFIQTVVGSESSKYTKLLGLGRTNGDLDSIAVEIQSYYSRNPTSAAFWAMGALKRNCSSNS